MGIPERGIITVSSNVVPCRIGYYEVEVKPEGHYLPGRRYYVFVGKSANGRVLSDADALIRKTQDDAEFGVREEIAARTLEYRRRIVAMEQELDRLELDVSRLENGQDTAVTGLERLQLKKKANATRLEIKRKRDDLFLGKIRLEQELDEQLRRIRDDDTTVYRYCACSGKI